MRKQLSIALAIIVGSTLVNGQVLAQDGVAFYASEACLACDGLDGKQSNNDITPKIAGQN